MRHNFWKKGITLLLTLCMIWGCMLVPGIAALEQDLVQNATLAGYGPDGAPKQNPFGLEIGGPDNVRDGNPGSIWGWPWEDGAQNGMNLIAEFGALCQISSVYLEAKNEGTPNDQGEFGLYKIEYKGSDNEWKVAADDVPAKDIEQGGNTFQFGEPVLASAVKVTVTDWYTEEKFWAGISEFRVMGTANIPFETAPTLIEAGSLWSYYYFTNDTEKNQDLGFTWKAELPSDWKDANVNTTSWSTGAAPFTGASWGNNKAKTTINVEEKYKLQAVFSTTFELTNANEVTKLTLGLFYDENPDVYLNGQQVFTRTGFNNGIEDFDISQYKSALVDGQNVLTVYMENNINGGGFNFDLRLVADFAPVQLYKDGKVIIARADSCSPWKTGDIAKPSNMYDGKSDTCSGMDFKDGGCWYEFYFNGEVEINYLYLEKKNEGTTTREDGIYGHYKVLVKNENGGYDTVLTQIPVYPGNNHDDGSSVPDGMDGYYVKLEKPLKASMLRIEVEDWYGTGCWAGISEFGAWNTLDAYTITFQDGNQVVAEHTLPVGETLHELKVPAVPEKEGKIGKWSQEDFSNVTEDLVVTAVFETIGDLTGDEKVDIRDVSRLLMYLADGNSIVIHGSTDVNADGETNITDVSELLAIISA